MLGHLADAFHFDLANGRMLPLVYAIFDVAFDHSRAAEQLLVQLSVFPYRSGLGSPQAEQPGADLGWRYIIGQHVAGMIMDQPKGSYHNPVATLLDPFDVVG